MVFQINANMQATYQFIQRFILFDSNDFYHVLTPRNTKYIYLWLLLELFQLLYLLRVNVVVSILKDNLNMHYIHCYLQNNNPSQQKPTESGIQVIFSVCLYPLYSRIGLQRLEYKSILNRINLLNFIFLFLSQMQKPSGNLHRNCYQLQ